CGGGPRVERPSGLHTVDVVDVEIERLLLVDGQAVGVLVQRLGGRGARVTVLTGGVVLDRRHNHAGDIDLVAATDLALVVTVDQRGDDRLRLQRLENRGAPDLWNEVRDS